MRRKSIIEARKNKIGERGLQHSAAVRRMIVACLSFCHEEAVVAPSFGQILIRLEVDRFFQVFD